MKNIADNIHIGELIAVSRVFNINAFQMVELLENDMMEVFETKEAFIEKYGDKENYGDLNWCELNNGKIITKTK